jgi:hypothetical protein
VQGDHHQVPRHEGREPAQGHEVPDSDEPVPPEQSHQQRQLRRLVERQPGYERKESEQQRRRVGQLLERVVGLIDRRLRPAKKIVPDHGPHARDIAGREQDHSVAAAGELTRGVDQAGAGEHPHEREMPLEGAAEPSAQGDPFGRIPEILLRDLRAKARKGEEDPQTARAHDDERHRRQPVGNADVERMLVRRRPRRTSLLPACDGHDLGRRAHMPPYQL